MKVKGKIKSSHLILGKAGELRVSIFLFCLSFTLEIKLYINHIELLHFQVLLTLSNNSVEIHSLNTSSKQTEVVCQRQITKQGHHAEVRAVSFSSDNLAIVTGSGDSVKLWNRHSLSCLRTIPTAYVLSICLVPGDRHAIAGLKDGRLLILDLNTGDILEEIPAGQKEIWSLCLLPDQV